MFPVLHLPAIVMDTLLNPKEQPMTDTDKPTTAEAIFTSLLRQNASELTMCDTRLREAQEAVTREEKERERLNTIRKGLQAGRQAVLVGQGAEPSPST